MSAATSTTPPIPAQSSHANRIQVAIFLVLGLAVVLVLGVIVPNGHLILAGVATLAVVLAAFEYASIAAIASDSSEKTKKKVGRKSFSTFLVTLFLILLPGLVTTLCIFSGFDTSTSINYAGFCSMLGIFLISALPIVRARKDLSIVGTISTDILFGLALVGIGGSSLILLSVNISRIGWLIPVVCVNDIAAYYVGRSLGGPKLAPAISPNKTISGSIGGFVAGVFVGGLLGSFLLHEEINNAAIISIGVIFFAQMGDLLKSATKRLHEVKDSGTLLGAHGGVLDRLDGMLAGSIFLLIALQIAS